MSLAGARGWPGSSIARLGGGAADRVRDEAGVTRESISTWSRAGRDIARLRKQQFQLRRERDAKIRRLGPAFYADESRAHELKAEATELDERIAAKERQLQRTIVGARRQTRKERAAVVATKIRTVVEAPEPERVVEAVAEAPAEDEPLSGDTRPTPSSREGQARSR